MKVRMQVPRLRQTQGHGCQTKEIRHRQFNLIFDHTHCDLPTLLHSPTFEKR